MRSQIEGSQAVAHAVTLCRPEVIAAYPISPQTHIVESLSDRVRTGELASCQYMMVESEFGAMSACIGASGAGARTYTATSSQGLLFMAEALFNASGLGLPVVMTVANRAIGAPRARFATVITTGSRRPEALGSASAMNSSPWLAVAVYVRAPAAEAPMQADIAPNSLSTLRNSQVPSSPAFTICDRPSTMWVCGEIG